MKSCFSPGVAVVAAGLALIAAAPSAQAQTTFNGTGGTIPDNSVVGISSTITAAPSYTIGSFSSITITGFTHTWVGDLVATLTHNGVSVDIIDRVGSVTVGGIGDSSNLGGSYTFALGGADISAAAALLGTNDVIAPGTYAPFANPGFGSSSFTQTFADFSGLDVSGAWVLNISDRASLDTGAFTGWSFTVTQAASAAAPEPGSIALALFGAAPLTGILLRRRRRAGKLPA